MRIEWPEGLAELEKFLVSKGLYFQCRGPVAHSGGEFRWQYGNDKIAVRVSADRGMVWSPQISDVDGWPDQWWVTCELQDLISGTSGASSLCAHRHSVRDGMKTIRDEIVAAFAPVNRTITK